MSSLIEDNRAIALLQINKAHLTPSVNEFLKREQKFLQTFFFTCQKSVIILESLISVAV